MRNGTDTIGRITDKLQKWKSLLAEKREARAEAQGVRLEQIDLQIALIERFCEDLYDVFSDTDQDSGIAIFNREGFAWMSNYHNPVDALEEFDQEIGIGPRDRSLRCIAKKLTLFEIPEQDLPHWQDASLDDHPDTSGLRKISL